MPKAFLVRRKLCDEEEDAFQPKLRREILEHPYTEEESEKRKRSKDISDSEHAYYEYYDHFYRQQLTLLNQYYLRIQKARILSEIPKQSSKEGTDFYKDKPTDYKTQQETFCNDQNILHSISTDNKLSSKYFECIVCQKTFERSSSLSNHMLIHSNIKSFECKKCHLCFLRKSDLSKHEIIHSGEKPYQCKTCGKCFSQSSNMLTHQRRHTGIRPFACNKCGKSFYRKVDVRRHMLIHRKS